jgi:hypothetical protein
MNTGFAEKIETIKTRHNVNIKPFTAYGNNKYPPYFLDTLTSL